MSIESLSPNHPARKRFSNSTSSNLFLRLFECRHEESIQFTHLLRQEKKRWTAVNAETVATHFATVEALVREYYIDAARMWNLDEPSGTICRDVNGNTRLSRYRTRSSTADMPVPEFLRTNRAT